MLQKTDLFYHQYLPEIKDETAFREYLNLVEIGLNREKPEGYTEKHHIVPRCYFPKEFNEKTNKINNIVIFKANEHFIAHFYLKEAFKDDSSIISLMMLANCKNRWHVNRNNFIDLSIEYEKLRKNYKDIVSKNFKGFKWFYNVKTNKPVKVNIKDIEFYKNSKDFKPGYSKERIERCKHKVSLENRKNMSIANKKIWATPGYKEKMSKLHKEIAHVPLNFVGCNKETVWLTNGQNDIRISKNDENKINELKNLGYVFGRSNYKTKGKIKK